jgi:hypothetical protein
MVLPFFNGGRMKLLFKTMLVTALVGLMTTVVGGFIGSSSTINTGVGIMTIGFCIALFAVMWE